ncbi:MAG TPA: hypothetical protein V6D28_27840 [Leptolyngbyaceae cyanobacterium]
MIVSNGDINIKTKVATALSTPIEAPNTKWDTWDVRVFWGKPKISTQSYPPNYMPIAGYLFPHGQIWP